MLSAWGGLHHLPDLTGKHSGQAFKTGRLCPRLTPWPRAQLGFRGGFRSQEKWGVGIGVTVATALEICLSKDGGDMPPLSRVKPLPLMGLAALALHCSVIEDIVLSGLLGLF